MGVLRVGRWPLEFTDSEVVERQEKKGKKAKDLEAFFRKGPGGKRDSSSDIASLEYTDSEVGQVEKRKKEKSESQKKKEKSRLSSKKKKPGFASRVELEVAESDNLRQVREKKKKFEFTDSEVEPVREKKKKFEVTDSEVEPVREKKKKKKFEFNTDSEVEQVREKKKKKKFEFTDSEVEQVREKKKKKKEKKEKKKERRRRPSISAERGGDPEGGLKNGRTHNDVAEHYEQGYFQFENCVTFCLRIRSTNNVEHSVRSVSQIINELGTVWLLEIIY